MDTRKKACPNEKCDCYKSEKFKASDNFCPKCGTELVFVCKGFKCYKPIEDIGPKHDYCEECLAKQKDTKDKIVNGAKQVVASAGAVVLAFTKKEVRDAVKNTLKNVKDVVAKK